MEPHQTHELVKNSGFLIPTRTVCLHTVGWWIFKRACGRFTDSSGKCSVHGYEEEIRY